MAELRPQVNLLHIQNEDPKSKSWQKWDFPSMVDRTVLNTIQPVCDYVCNVVVVISSLTVA